MGCTAETAGPNELLVGCSRMFKLSNGLTVDNVFWVADHDCLPDVQKKWMMREYIYSCIADKILV